MTWTVRSVRPTTALISRTRAVGLRAIATSTCPCPVSSVQLPPAGRLGCSQVQVSRIQARARAFLRRRLLAD
jgi:hypothetical protein